MLRRAGVQTNAGAEDEKHAHHPRTEGTSAFPYDRVSYYLSTSTGTSYCYIVISLKELFLSFFFPFYRCYREPFREMGIRLDHLAQSNDIEILTRSIVLSVVQRVDSYFSSLVADRIIHRDYIPD